MLQTVLMALSGTGFACSMTALGSAVVFLFSKELPDKLQRAFLGFAAGVMIAASIWSLLIPAIEESQKSGTIGWLPAAGGFLLGGLFLLILERLLPHFVGDSIENLNASTPGRRNLLLIFAVTIHNVPEGMAVGLAFALTARAPGNAALYASAFALALGIGIQNFPEGAAISLPLRKEGISRPKAFLCGVASGIVEPIAGVLTVLVSGIIAPFLPWFLSFAAGAMIYVVVEELIPEAHLGERSNAGTLGVMAGFLLMMILDVALG